MRRLLSLMLLAVFGMPFVAPLLAGAQGSESALPACCRRNGQHHCSMGMMPMGAESQAPHWTAPPSKCPYCPEAARVFAFHDVAFATAMKDMAFFHFARPLGKVQTESRRRIARERSRHKRGPPRTFFA